MDESEILKSKIRGAIVALVTPTTPDYEVDLPRFRDNVRFALEGVEGNLGCLMAAGGGGEGYFLDTQQWKALIETFADEVQGRVPTMAGVFELNTKRAVEMIRFAEACRIDFVQLAPPHYEKPTDVEVYQHYRLVNDALSKIGIVVYHTYWSMPEQYEMRLPLMTKIAELEHVVGIKWSSAQFKNFLEVLFGLGDKLAIIDNQGWVDQVNSAYGMQAFMCFIGNYAPQKTAELARLFIDGQYERWAEEKARASAHRNVLMREILDLVHGTVGAGEVCTLAEGTLGKTLCELVGRPAGPPFPPQFEPTPEQRAELKGRLEAKGLLPLGFG